MGFENEYNNLLAAITPEIDKITSLHAPFMHCAPGCSECCKEFSVLPVEARIIQQSFNLLPEDVKTKLRSKKAGKSESCPFLLDNLCAIYQHRPLICRTQGLPLAYVDHDTETIELSACAMNFPQDFAPGVEDLFFMDRFIEMLTRINRDFVREIKQYSNTDRICLRQII